MIGQKPSNVMSMNTVAQSHFDTPSFQMDCNACFGYVKVKKNSPNKGFETFLNCLLVADLQAKDYDGPILRIIDESLKRTEFKLTGASVHTAQVESDHFLLCLSDGNQVEVAAGCRQFRDNWVSTLNNTIALLGSNVQHTPVEDAKLKEIDIGDERRNRMNDSLISIVMQRTQLLESATNAIRSEQNIAQGVWLLTLYMVTTPFVLTFWWFNMMVGLLATLFIRLPLRVISFVITNSVMIASLTHNEFLSKC